MSSMSQDETRVSRQCLILRHVPGVYIPWMPQPVGIASPGHTRGMSAIGWHAASFLVGMSKNTESNENESKKTYTFSNVIGVTIEVQAETEEQADALLTIQKQVLRAHLNNLPQGIDVDIDMGDFELDADAS